MAEEKYSSRISYTLIGNLFRAVISFVTSMFIARELAPENYGRYIFLIGTFIALKQIAVTDEPFSDAISYAYDANSYESFLNFPLYVSANINIPI